MCLCVCVFVRLQVYRVVQDGFGALYADVWHALESLNIGIQLCIVGMRVIFVYTIGFQPINPSEFQDFYSIT